MSSDTDGAASADGGRELGMFSLLALGINGIVGVGIFFTPNLVAGVVPNSLGVLAYGLTLLALLPVAFTYARLGAHFDRDGGPYVWAQAAFGESAGFLVGFVAYASAVLSTAAVIAGLGEYSAPLFGWTTSSEKHVFSVVCALIFAIIVLSGLSPSAWVWSTLTVLKLIPLVLLVGAFITVHHEAVAPSAAVVPDWSRAALLLVFPLQGFEIVPVPGSRVRSPKRAIPFATVGSLVLCTGLYALLHLACVRSVPGLAQQETPLIAAAQNLGGSALSRVVSAGTNVSAVGIAFGMMAMTPRYLSALEADGRGRFFSLESRRHVPFRALFVTLVLVVVLVSVGALSRLFVLSSVAVLFQYSVSVLSLVWLALGRRHGLSPRAALAAPFALVALSLIARAIERAELWVMAGVVLAAFLLGWARRKVWS